jgi:prevent-host-death family protein
MTKSDTSSSVHATTISVGVHEAKTRLSELLRTVATGQEVEICRNGQAVARLVPAIPKQRRTFGRDAGRFVVPDDFDAPLDDDVLAEFEQ